MFFPSGSVVCHNPILAYRLLVLVAPLFDPFAKPVEMGRVIHHPLSTIRINWTGWHCCSRSHTNSVCAWQGEWCWTIWASLCCPLQYNGGWDLILLPSNESHAKFFFNLDFFWSIFVILCRMYWPMNPARLSLQLPPPDHRTTWIFLTLFGGIGREELGRTPVFFANMLRPPPKSMGNWKVFVPPWFPSPKGTEVVSLLQEVKRSNESTAQHMATQVIRTPDSLLFEFFFLKEGAIKPIGKSKTRWPDKNYSCWVFILQTLSL